jgi:XTP/dITP diphosphohydrolase
MSDITLVLATRNKGKIIELRKLLQDFDVNIKGLDEFSPVPEVEEDGNTFEENAYKKASFTAQTLGLPALADDSGLVVNALDGAPGVMSARYAGEYGSDEEKYNKLLKEMKGKTDRSAYFECAIVIAKPKGRSSKTFTGRCDGEITFEPMGEDGFGYDPVFLYPSLSKTFAQIPLDEKNKISHRGKAMAELKENFSTVLKWLKK